MTQLQYAVSLHVDLYHVYHAIHDTEFFVTAMFILVWFPKNNTLDRMLKYTTSWNIYIQLRTKKFKNVALD